MITLNPLIQFPIFSSPSPHHHRPTTEIRLSRWNNANAEQFIRREQSQKQLEDQIRSEKRFSTAERLAHSYNPAPPYLTTFKSTGTPSSPSKSSIPAKFSKYSKPAKNNQTKHSQNSHPAFRYKVQTRKLPSNIANENEPASKNENDNKACVVGVNVKVDEKGVGYQVPEAPFVYQYSYTETPKMKPLKLREPLVSPFGPETMSRPWTGRKPLPPSKKKLPEFDSFKLPPRDKKGVKPVQSPGPFVEGTGPRYVKTREELLGEPLTKQEIEDLIKTCQKATRQLNIGRDGLTHNMLDNIHAHWKRRRVCKIKCKGVCTVDMNNVHQQLEEKTGGKIIYSRGGVLYLFRGRNYNYRTRPRFPLMLWRPVSPVYPRLVKHAPDGLTLAEATEMRKRGRSLIPICKLAKNGVYNDLAKNVKEAFEACELVRINCQGLNGSDFRKIGAKLRDLVPCVLISFEEEHILVWRGHDWKSSLDLEDEPSVAGKSKADKVELGLPTSEENAGSKLVSHETVGTGITNNLNSSVPRDGETVNLKEFAELNIKESENSMATTSNIPSEASSELSFIPKDYKSEGPLQISTMDVDFCISPAVEVQSDLSTLSQNDAKKLEISDSSSDFIKPVATSILCTERVLKLREHAVETGSAVILTESDLNADTVFQKSISLAKSAPPGPVFKYKPRRVRLNSSDEQKISNAEEESITVSEIDTRSSGTKTGSSGTKTAGRIPRNKSMTDLKEDYLNIAPRGTLKVDELAKLLA